MNMLSKVCTCTLLMTLVGFLKYVYEASYILYINIYNGDWILHLNMLFLYSLKFDFIWYNWCCNICGYTSINITSWIPICIISQIQDIDLISTKIDICGAINLEFVYCCAINIFNLCLTWLVVLSMTYR